MLVRRPLYLGGRDAISEGVTRDDRDALPLGTLAAKAWPFVRPFRGVVALVGVVALATAGLSALEPLLLKSVIDALEARGGVVRGLALFAAALVVRELATAALEWLVWRVRIGVDEALLSAVVDRLHALPLSFHRKHTVGAILTKVERGISGSVAALSALGFQLLPSLVYLVLAAVLMVRLDGGLALVVLGFAPLPAIVGALASGEQVKRERGLMRRWTRIFSRFNEVLSGMLVVKSFAMEEAEKRRFLGRVRAANRRVVRGVLRDTSVGAGRNLVVVVARLAVMAVGGVAILHGRMQIGTLVAFLGYAGGVFAPVQSLTGMYQTVRRGRVALETVFDILGADDPMRDAPDARDPGPLRGEIELRGVRFGYRDGQTVLDGVDLRVRRGEHVALVGPSGGGKSTILALLQRLYDPDGGAVLLDGHDVRTLRQLDVRKQIGVVLQDGFLFSDTIRANIAFGRPGATDAEVEAAARAANAHEFIAPLPDGYDTVVGPSGSTLSGGERQRVAIARALLKDAPILVLDEATSALDAASEAKVQEALARLAEGRTTVTIAHRLATVVSADRILVMKGGRLVEEGRHAELLARGGVYAALVAHQLEGLAAEPGPSSLPEPPVSQERLGAGGVEAA